MVLCLLLSGWASAQSLDNLFFQQGSGNIYNINDTTGATTLLASESGHFWNGAAYDAQNGLVYVDDIGTNFALGQSVTNTIYSFNPFNPAGGVTEVGVLGITTGGTTSTVNPAISGAGFHIDPTTGVGYYYGIGTGTNTLLAYNFTGHSGSGTISQNTTFTQTLGGLGSGVSLTLGDIDFIGNSIYISGGQVSGGTQSASYYLYNYANVASTTTVTSGFPVTEPQIGVGIGYDVSLGKLVLVNSNGELDYVNSTTGAIVFQANMSGALTTPGAGDFTIVTVPVPEPAYSAGIVLLLVLGGCFMRRISRTSRGESVRARLA